MFDDPTHRYAPSYVCTLTGYRAVIGSTYYPIGVDRPRSPIRVDMGAVELRTSDGYSRWYGCERAYINTQLRLVIVGHDSRDEVRQSWKPVTRKFRDA